MRAVGRDAFLAPDYANCEISSGLELSDPERLRRSGEWVMRENVKKGEAALGSGLAAETRKTTELAGSSRLRFDTDTERCADYPLAKILRGT